MKNYKTLIALIVLFIIIIIMFIAILIITPVQNDDNNTEQYDENKMITIQEGQCETILLEYCNTEQYDNYIMTSSKLIEIKEKEEISIFYDLLNNSEIFDVDQLNITSVFGKSVNMTISSENLVQKIYFSTNSDAFELITDQLRTVGYDVIRLESQREDVEDFLSIGDETKEIKNKLFDTIENLNSDNVLEIEYKITNFENMDAIQIDLYNNEELTLVEWTSSEVGILNIHDNFYTYYPSSSTDKLILVFQNND